jgi:hypothetical protein
MRSVATLLARLALVLVALAAYTAPVLTAARSNDSFTFAKLVTLGFGETLDTTQTTSDALVNCGVCAILSPQLA